MIGKLVKGIGKLGMLSIGIVAALGAWDYLQRSQAAQGSYSVQDYAASVSERYGDDATEIAHSTLQLAQVGYHSGVEWLQDSGVFEMMGLEPPHLDAADNVTAAIEPVEAGEAPLVVASVERIIAPESSLYPRARAVK